MNTNTERLIIQGTNSIGLYDMGSDNAPYAIYDNECHFMTMKDIPTKKEAKKIMNELLAVLDDSLETKLAKTEALLEQIKHERDILGQAIADAASKAKIWDGEVDLTVPHLLTLAEKLAKLAPKLPTDIEAYWKTMAYECEEGKELYIRQHELSGNIYITSNEEGVAISIYNDDNEFKAAVSVSALDLEPSSDPNQ